MRKPPAGLFITGTDTDVGKTYVAALIARALVSQGARVGVYKPVASGCRTENGQLVAADAVALWEAAGRRGTLEMTCPQCFAAPLAPHLAARVAGKQVDGPLLRLGLDSWADCCDVVIVEGAGGLLSPVSDEDYVADLVWEFRYPLIVVVRNVLGTINQTLTTLVVAETFRDGLPVAGIVLNSAPPDEVAGDESLASNRAELAARAIPPVLGEVAWQADAIDPAVDWLALAKRAK